MQKQSGSSFIRLSIQVFLLITVPLLAASSWRGPARDGKYTDEKNLLKTWPAAGPKLVLTLSGLGEGFSSPTVTNDRIYVSGMIEKTGYLFAFDMQGKLLWKTAYGADWSGQYSGVRGSPTPQGNYVYILSGLGRVVCLNAVDGKEVWSVDMRETFGLMETMWGHAETILLADGRLICTPGGKKASVAALDPATGKTLWTVNAGKEKAGYCSPVLVTHANKPLLLTMLENCIIGIDPASATLLWKHQHKTDYGINPNTPIYQNGNIIYASGYGNGAGMLKLSDDGKTITEVWREKKFDPQIGGIVLFENNLYGFGQSNRGLHCLDITTGKIIHTFKQNKGGALIAAEGMLYCYNEEGTVFLAKPEKTGITMVSSFKIDKGNGPHWAHPVINSGKLFVRHGEFVFVYDIRG
jgi:outer membrane protein assembly factor BamB